MREWFPEQTKSIPASFLWLQVFIADLVLVFRLAEKLGFDLLSISYKLRQAAVLLHVFLTLVLFWVEATVYNRIVSLFR